jgi:predicted nucleic acid-binding protein
MKVSAMLNSPPVRWVLDASVIINLLSMSDPARIVNSLGAPCIVPDIAAREILRIEHPSRKNNDPLEEVRKIVEIVELKDAEWELFGELVGAVSPHDLDDGEAAVLALTALRGGACLLDERKCIRIARARVPPVASKTTVDVLHWCASNGFSRAEITECVVDALRYGRMRVPAEHYQWVRAVVGAEHVLEFPSMRRSGPVASVRRKP